MCTVSYVSISKEQFVLTSNRDELRTRSTLPPAPYKLNNETVYCPKDNVAGGTWIGASQSGRICCLLNGAFDFHERKETYARSRGLIVMEAFESSDITEFFRNVQLNDVEPFTLVVVDLTGVRRLFEFRWDGQKTYLKELNAQEEYVWASATLYTKTVRQQRDRWFGQWMQQREHKSSDSMFRFHRSSQTLDKANDMVMKRSNGVQTLSITQIEVIADTIHLRYSDLTNNEKTRLNFEIEHRMNG